MIALRMADQPTGSDGWYGDRRAEILARRQRRVAGGGGLLALAAIAAAGLILLVGGSASRHPLSATAVASRAGWRRHRGPVPILEYHELGRPPTGVEYPQLWVGRSDFRRQMDWLGTHGFQAVTLSQVERAWFGDGMLPARPVVITFDDGYRPQFTFALPVLRGHGWAGVLNLKAEGSDLYPSNVEAMIAAGWGLAAHTIHHLDLTGIDEAQLREEVAGSRALLRREYGVPVDNFCYPAGRFDGPVVAAVEAAGYSGATTEVPGYAQRERPFELNRFEILGSSGVAGMAADLSSGHDGGAT
jgi:peptidoglycan/xylan/chitin deacetylase (PgdA/CDA1 family)